MKRLSLKNALKVAGADMWVGVCHAIEKLQKMGFDCSYYWDTMEDIEDVDSINLQTRDKQYELLGIKKVMDLAYELVNIAEYIYARELSYAETIKEIKAHIDIDLRTRKGKQIINELELFYEREYKRYYH